jgi:hypothetical protein
MLCLCSNRERPAAGKGFFGRGKFSTRIARFSTSEQSPETLGAHKRVEIQKWWPIIKKDNVMP